MDELTRAPERILIDCFRALDGGATSDDCLARYQTQADGIRGVLDMRAQLLTLKTTAPSPTTFASGREALLARVVRPLASSHPGSMETQGRQARGLVWRPATRAAFAGALLFAISSCAIGVSATPAGDKVGDVLPQIPTIDMPEQRPPYPFPQNDAPPSMLPDVEPTVPASSRPAEPAPGLAPAPQIAPPPASSGSDQPEDSDVPSSPASPASPVQPEPVPEPVAEPVNPGDTWLPPVNAHEDDPAVETPEPAEQHNEDEAAHSDDDDDADEDRDGNDEDGNDSDASNEQDTSSDDGDDNDDDSRDHRSEDTKSSGRAETSDSP